MHAFSKPQTRGKEERKTETWFKGNKRSLATVGGGLYRGNVDVADAQSLSSVEGVTIRMHVHQVDSSHSVNKPPISLLNEFTSSTAFMALVGGFFDHLSGLLGPNAPQPTVIHGDLGPTILVTLIDLTDVEKIMPDFYTGGANYFTNNRRFKNTSTFVLVVYPPAGYVAVKLSRGVVVSAQDGAPERLIGRGSTGAFPHGQLARHLGPVLTQLRRLDHSSVVAVAQAQGGCSGMVYLRSHDTPDEEGGAELLPAEAATRTIGLLANLTTTFVATDESRGSLTPVAFANLPGMECDRCSGKTLPHARGQ